MLHSDLEIVCFEPLKGKHIDGYAGFIRWAENWDWGVGKIVADRINSGRFTVGDIAFVAQVDKSYAGFCLLEKNDAWGVDVAELSPFVTAVYVDPKHRGRRISEKLVAKACAHAKTLGYEIVYLISGEVNFYEKYGFEPFMRTTTLDGRTEPVFRKPI